MPASYWIGSIPALLLFLGSFLTAYLSWLSWRAGKFPGGRIFSLVQADTSLWSFLAGLENIVPSPDSKVFWAEMTWFAIVMAPTGWVLFIWRYVVGESRSNQWQWLMALPPIIMEILALTNKFHHLVYISTLPYDNSVGEAICYIHGPAHFCMIIYCYLLLLIAAVVIISALPRAPSSYRSHYLSLLIAMMFPWAASLVSVTDIFRPFHFDSTPFSFIIMGGIFHWLIHHHRLFNLLSIARGALIDALPDPVLVVDKQGVIVDGNRAGHLITPLLTKGDPFNALIAFPEKSLGKISESVIDISPRTFEVHRVPLSFREHPVGLMLLFHDITTRRQAENQLQSTLGNFTRTT